MIYEPERKVKICFVKILPIISNGFFEKLKFWWKNILGIITIRYAEDNVVFEIPINVKKIAKLISKINIQISNLNVEAVVFSEEIKNVIDEREICVPVLNGKFLMKNSIIDIIDRICMLRNEEICFLKIHILVENYIKENINIIYDIISKVKNVSIVTSNIKNYKNIEEKLLDTSGVAISVGNNRKKGLKTAELIINFDFDNELIKKYNINRDAIIINCSDSKLEMDSGFSGIIINNLIIGNNIGILEYFKIYDILNNFKIEELYESLIFKKNYDRIVQRKVKDNINIQNFVGNRGIINIKEIECSQNKRIKSIDKT